MNTDKSRMRITIVIVLFALATHAQNVDQKTQQQIDELFPTPNPNDDFNGFEEVTKTEDGGNIGALLKCGEGSAKDRQICVPYHMCDGRTKTVVQTGVTDGFGIIDIRFGENACEHPLDVCCQIPSGGLDPKLPLPTRDSSSTPQPPPTLPNTGIPQIDLPVTQPTVRSYCGIRNPNGIDFKITGQKANEAEYGEFPWMVAIISKNEVNSERPLLCGGSLITPNVVLTGAHCVNKFDTNSIKIRAGEWDTQTTRERLPYQERDVANIIIHNEFNPNNLFNDFALLILTYPVTRADNVGTICLPTQGQTISSNECYVSGWGKKFFGKQGQFQAILKKIDLPTVPQDQCESLLKRTRLGENFLLHRSFMCAGGIEGKDACTGDGGSPLVCPDPMNPGRYVQAGIVGWGIGCGESNVPGVYADVAKFRSWIDGQMERLNIDTAPYNL